MNEKQIKDDWNYIKETLERHESPAHPYLTDKELEIFEGKMTRILREEKLKRILNI